MEVFLFEVVQSWEVFSALGTWPLAYLPCYFPFQRSFNLGESRNRRTCLVGSEEEDGEKGCGGSRAAWPSRLASRLPKPGVKPR